MEAAAAAAAAAQAATQATVQLEAASAANSTAATATGAEQQVAHPAAQVRVNPSSRWRLWCVHWAYMLAQD